MANASQSSVGATQPDGDAERKHVNLILAKAEDIVYGPAIVLNSSTNKLLNSSKPNISRGKTRMLEPGRSSFLKCSNGKCFKSFKW